MLAAQGGHRVGFQASPSFQAVPHRRAKHFFTQPTRARATSTSVHDDLIPWLASHGVDLDRLALQVAPGGLVATRPLAKGETAVSIPEAAWITKETALNSPSIGRQLSDLEPWLAIAIFLIYERSRADSPLRPYLDALPREEIASPVAWSDSELVALEGTQLLASVQAYRAYYQQRYAALRDGLFLTHPDVFPPQIFSYEAFLWGACTVRARAHAPLDTDEGFALIPFADLTRHRRGAGGNVRWVVRQTNSGFFGRGSTKSLDIEADRALGEGEEIAMDYGLGRTEGQVLLNHGVVDIGQLDSMVGTFALTVSLPPDDRFFDDKIDILEQVGLRESNEFVLEAGARLPEMLLPALRLVNLQGADAFLLESIFRNEVWEHMQLPVSEDNEQAVCQSMADGCRAMVAASPTAADEDAAALSAAAPGSRAQVAAAIRLGEKQALEGAARYFEGRLGRLREVEYYADRRLKRLGLLDKEGKPTDWESFFEDGIA